MKRGMLSLTLEERVCERVAMLDLTLSNLSQRRVAEVRARRDVAARRMVSFMVEWCGLLRALIRIVVRSQRLGCRRDGRVILIL